MKDQYRTLTRRKFLSTSILFVPSSLLLPDILNGSSKADQTQALDEALEMLAGTGPEYAGGLANHGPMAAEALSAMGRSDAIVQWVGKYKPVLVQHPATRPSIPKQQWRESLGNFALIGEWIAFFGRELEEKPWRTVVGEWSQNLAPGLSAAAGHGLLRTAHISRALSLKETTGRRKELAEGLGYWAARYSELPASAAKSATPKAPSLALKEVQLVPDDQRISGGSIVRGLASLEKFPSFAPVLNLVNTSGDAGSFVSNLTETFATVYVQKPVRRNLISFVHALTASSAVRLLLPFVAEPAREALLRYAWQLAAGIYSAFGELNTRELRTGEGESRETLIDRAVSNGDEHAIKFTEACLREYALNPKQVYLTAARLVCDEL